jgi:hypothetical protein
MLFVDGSVFDVSISPKKRPNPKNIPVTKEQLRGVLDLMTGAFLRARPDPIAFGSGSAEMLSFRVEP